MFILSDIFIGDFNLTQGFGENPSAYAKFGLKGHNGQDWGTPSNTQIVATASGWISEVGSDPTGYGNYVKIVHDGFLTLYAHLDHAVVKVNDRVIQGQLIGLSDNTGNSTGPHLHFGVAPCDTNGIKTEVGNGYSGYIDPNSCKWNLKNLKAPATPIAQQQVMVESETFTKLVSNSTEYDKFVSGGYKNIEAVQQEVKRLNEDKTNLENELVQANKNAKDYLDKLAEIHNDDSDLGIRNKELSDKFTIAENELSAISQEVAVNPYNFLQVIDAIKNLKKPVEEQVKYTTKAYEDLYRLVFEDGYGIYKRARQQSKSLFSKIVDKFWTWYK